MACTPRRAHRPSECGLHAFSKRVQLTIVPGASRLSVLLSFVASHIREERRPADPSRGDLVSVGREG